MTRTLLALTLTIALPLAAAGSEWKTVAPGVDYREFATAHTDIHVARIDLTNPEIQIVTTPAPYRGTTVSDFAQKTKAIVAINGDYFDSKFVPRGLMVGQCDQWAGAKDNRMHEYVVAVDNGVGSVQRMSDFEVASTVTAAVSGWPVLIKSCTAFTDRELPGSDVFTRSPQPRTAAGVSKDGTTMYFVVADGRRTGVPGLTLGDLGEFMAEELGACSAVNLDGGGSSAMWVSTKVVNQPADGVERRVGDHLAVVLKSDAACPPPPVQQTASTKTTTTTITTTTVVTTTPAQPMTSAAPPTAPPAAPPTATTTTNPPRP